MKQGNGFFPPRRWTDLRWTNELYTGTCGSCHLWMIEVEAYKNIVAPPEWVLEDSLRAAHAQEIRIVPCLLVKQTNRQKNASIQAWHAMTLTTGWPHCPRRGPGRCWSRRSSTWAACWDRSPGRRGSAPAPTRSIWFYRIEEKRLITVVVVSRAL